MSFPSDQQRQVTWGNHPINFRRKIRSHRVSMLKLSCFALACIIILSSSYRVTVSEAAESATPTAEASPTPTAASPVEFIWRTPKNALHFPVHLAVDGQGNVYVADEGKDRIQKFDHDGNSVTTWGSRGSGDGQFVFICLPDCPPWCPPSPPGWTRCPHLPSGGVAVNREGHVLVADVNGRIQEFDSSGKFLLKWGSLGTGEGQFNGPPHDLAVDGQGNIYVTDWRGDSGRVQKFDSSGKFLLKWGSLGTGEGEFGAGPGTIAVDGQGNVYVVDSRNNRVQKFDSSGKFLLKWGSFGFGDGEFSSPEGIAIDSQDGVYVTDNGNRRVQKFDSSGKFLLKWGSYGTGNGQFSYAGGIAVDGQGNIYVADINFSDDRVQKFRLK